MERIIRPFQTLSVTPPRRSLTASGGSGNGPVRVTVSGGINAGDQIVVNISGPVVPGNPVTVQYTVVGGDTLASVVAGIVAAINADANLASVGITAAVGANSPTDLIIAQPQALQPQATVSISASGLLSVAVSGETIAISPGKRGQIRTYSGSVSDDRSYYAIKMPHEMSTIALAIRASTQNLKAALDNIIPRSRLRF